MNAFLLATDSAEKESPPTWVGTQKEDELIKIKVDSKILTNGQSANPFVSYRGAVHAPKLRLGTPRQFLDRLTQRLLWALLGGAP